MIFVTVGSQLPFDRLVMAIDEWAGFNTDTKVIVQAGKTNLVSKHCEFKKYIEPVEWERLLFEAEIVIAHAGMGTILKCLDNQKPLIIMPREWKSGEIRNDHQLATVKYFKDTSGVYIVNNSDELIKAIKKTQDSEYTLTTLAKENLDNLIGELRRFSVNKK